MDVMEVESLGVTSGSGSVMKAREKWATVAQHTQIKGRKDGATVAWRSPGLGLDIYIESETMRQCVLCEETKEWQKGRIKKWGSASDKPRGVICKERTSE